MRVVFSYRVAVGTICFYTPNAAALLLSRHNKITSLHVLGFFTLCSSNIRTRSTNTFYLNTQISNKALAAIPSKERSIYYIHVRTKYELIFVILIIVLIRI